MPITLVQITDTHIHDQPGADFKGTQPDLYLRRVLAHINVAVASPDALILTGDITHDGSSQACEHLTELLDTVDCPIYVTPGNHDDLAVIEQHLLNENIRMPDDVQLAQWQLLFADSHVPGLTGGRIDDTTIDRINRSLLHNPNPALLFTHHPPLSINSRWMDEIGMQNGEPLLAGMLKHEHLKAIIFGHIHQLWDSRVQHLRLLGTPSSCVQFRPLSEEFGIDPLDPGYRLITLDEQDFDTRVLRCPMAIKKIVSGGQTGVDRAALDCAIELAIPHGGWCPAGRRALDGPLAPRYQLTETASEDYPQRTEWNVRDADATLVLYQGQLEGGTALTARLASRMEKPLKIVDLLRPAPINDVWQWLRENNVSVLNIAGPRHSKAQDIYSRSMQYLRRVLCALT